MLNTVNKTFCTTREAATLLGVSVGTVQLWVENGLLKAWKTAGGHRRVIRDSVDELLRANKSHALTAPIEPTQVAANIQTNTASPRRLKILVLDDDLLALRLYKANLLRWPMAPEVTIASDAIDALIMIGENQPDLLVTDLRMPGMDGFNMLRVLRTRPNLENTTIVVVSGLDAADIQARGGVPANIEILPKPIPFERLQAIGTGIVATLCLERRARP